MSLLRRKLDLKLNFKKSLLAESRYDDLRSVAVSHCKTDEAHVPHNFKSMESGLMTNLMQTSKS